MYSDEQHGLHESVSMHGAPNCRLHIYDYRLQHTYVHYRVQNQLGITSQ